MSTRARRALGRAALAAAALFCSACGDAPVPIPTAPRKAWSVSGGFLRDAVGRAVVLRGVNVSGAHKQKPYFDFHEPPDYLRVRDAWGMSAVRFLVSWAAIEPEKGQYDGAYLDDVALRMQWAREARLVVVLDMHQDLYGEGFGGNGAPRWTCDEKEYAAFEPVEPWFYNYLNPHVMACYDHLWTSAELRDHYAEACRRLAARLAGYGDVVIGLDVMNEPHWGSYPIGAFEPERLQPFYEAVVPALREAAPGWIAFIEPSSSRNIGYPTALTRLSFGDVVYAPHSYDADAESGKGFDPSHREGVLAHVAALATEAGALDAALWIGEYGGIASQPGIVPYMQAQYDAAGAAAAGTMYWHYGKDEGYGLLAPDGSEKAELLGVLVRPYPERVAGTPLAYAFDEESAAFTLTYRPDASIAAPTIIAVPARAFPTGVDVVCDGCSAEAKDGELFVTRPPAGDPATIVVRRR